MARTYGGILAGHAAKALFDLGRWPEAAARAEEGLDLDPLGPAAAWLHVVRARIDTNQGRPDDAAGHLATARSLMDGMSRSRCTCRRCWGGGRARGVAKRCRRRVGGGGAGPRVGQVRRHARPALGWVVWHVIRAQADAAELTGGPGPASGSTGGRPR